MCEYGNANILVLNSHNYHLWQKKLIFLSIINKYAILPFVEYNLFLCNLISGKILLMLISTLLHVCDDVIVVVAVVESGKRGGGGAIWAHYGAIICCRPQWPRPGKACTHTHTQTHRHKNTHRFKLLYGAICISIDSQSKKSQGSVAEGFKDPKKNVSYWLYV